MSIKRLAASGLSAIVLVGICSLLSGCTSAEETEVISGLQTALSDLQANRSLTEQFVRDIKTNLDPSDPNYAQLMDSYEDARNAYDHYLDSTENDEKAIPSRSLRGLDPVDVRNATADFLADATSVLKPTVNTRRIPFQRAVVIPDNLQATLHKLPKKAREKIINQFDRQVRWRSWSQLN